MSSDSSDVESLEHPRNNQRIKFEPIELVDEEEFEGQESANGVPIAVATIILESNSNSDNENGIKEEEDELLEEEYISTEQEIEIHHNYSCSNKYLNNGVSYASSSGSPSSLNSGCSPNPRKSNRGARSKPITDLVLTDEEKR